MSEHISSLFSLSVVCNFGGVEVGVEVEEEEEEETSFNKNNDDLLFLLLLLLLLFLRLRLMIEKRMASFALHKTLSLNERLL